ncbi:MAG: hypothetical protein R2849_20010 [Thermomicrobiales bacterium]
MTVIASLSIHYFDWKTSRESSASSAVILRPDGWFICRVNRVGDINFSYGRERRSNRIL